MENIDTKTTSWYMEEHHMETLPLDTPHSGRRTETAVTALAVVGFVVLIVAGMWLAVYATRFVPDAVNGVGEAAVYIGSLFTPSPAPSLSVVSSTASTTISFGTATTTGSTSSLQAATTTTQVVTNVVQTKVGEKTGNVTAIGGAPAPGVLFGLPDLAVTVRAVGYLTTAADDSFVTSSVVPVGDRPAILFTIKNIGTNVTGTWRFSATIPTRTTFTYQSEPQQSLNPGDSIDYTLGFDRASVGADQSIILMANFDNAIVDSNPDNNSIFAMVTIL